MRKQCINCKQNVEATKFFNWAAFIVGGLWTFGLNFLIYPIWYVIGVQPRCPICYDQNWSKEQAK